MCDPVSMTLAASQGMSAFGATLIGGAGTTGIFAGLSPTLGTGLINAASAINQSSTFVKGLQSVGTVMNVGNAIRGAGQLYGDYQTRKYAGMQTQLAIQQQEFQEKEFRRQRELEELDAKQEELDRRNVYYANLKKNRVYAAKYGYTTTSPSYRAFLESNRETAMMDSYFTRLLGREKSLSTTQQIDQTHVARKGLTEGYKTQTKASVTDTLLKTYDALTD